MVTTAENFEQQQPCTDRSSPPGWSISREDRATLLAEQRDHTNELKSLKSSGVSSKFGRLTLDAGFGNSIGSAQPEITTSLDPQKMEKFFKESGIKGDIPKNPELIRLGFYPTPKPGESEHLWTGHDLEIERDGTQVLSFHSKDRNYTVQVLPNGKIEVNGITVVKKEHFPADVTVLGDKTDPYFEYTLADGSVVSISDLGCQSKIYCVRLGKRAAAITDRQN